MSRAVILIGHGSKMPGFQKPMEALARKLRQDKAYQAVQCAYLEITSPSIPDAISGLVKKGVKKVLVVPYFLLSGMHVKIDIPGIVKQAALTHRGKAHILLSPYLGFDDTIVKLVKKRIRQAKLC